MRLFHVLLAAVVGSVLVVGCKAKEKTVDIAQTREVFARLSPDATVGVVSAVLADKGLLAVGGIDIAQHGVGETFVLMTPDRQIIGAGHVVAKTDTALHLSYDVNESGRAPQAGDLAVKPTM